MILSETFIQDIPAMEDVTYRGCSVGPTTRFYAMDNSVIVIEQDNHVSSKIQRIELTKEMVEQLPIMARRWIKK